MSHDVGSFITLNFVSFLLLLIPLEHHIYLYPAVPIYKFLMLVNFTIFNRVVHLRGRIPILHAITHQIYHQSCSCHNSYSNSPSILQNRRAAPLPDVIAFDMGHRRRGHDLARLPHGHGDTARGPAQGRRGRRQGPREGAPPRHAPQNRHSTRRLRGARS